MQGAKTSNSQLQANDEGITAGLSLRCLNARSRSVKTHWKGFSEGPTLQFGSGPHAAGLPYA